MGRCTLAQTATGHNEHVERIKKVPLATGFTLLLKNRIAGFHCAQLIHCADLTGVNTAAVGEKRDPGRSSLVMNK